MALLLGRDGVWQGRQHGGKSVEGNQGDKRGKVGCVCSVRMGEGMNAFSKEVEEVEGVKEVIREEKWVVL